MVHVAINGNYRGFLYTLASALRPQADEVIRKLRPTTNWPCSAATMKRNAERFARLFGHPAHLHFNQSPLNKLNFIRQLQSPGRTVLMAGDGFNDAGALKQSDVGVAVVESIGAFSPASDIIMSADMVPRLHEVLRFARSSVRVVRLSLLISSIYNVVGISIAARGLIVSGYLRHPHAAEFRYRRRLCLRPDHAAGIAASEGERAMIVIFLLIPLSIVTAATFSSRVHLGRALRTIRGHQHAFVAPAHGRQHQAKRESKE